MRKILLPLGVALIQMTAVSALAQGGGTADPAQAKAPPTASTTAQERAAARDARKTAGSEAARGPQMGQGESKPAAKQVVSSEERKAATEKRRAANRAANKAGELQRGGNADAPQKQ